MENNLFETEDGCDVRESQLMDLCSGTFMTQSVTNVVIINFVLLYIQRYIINLFNLDKSNTRIFKFTNFRSNC